MVQDSWGGSIALETPAGELLKRLASALPPGRPIEITVFSSAPIQLFFDRSLVSGDVDLFSDYRELAECVERAGLDEKHSEFFIQVGSELNFRTPSTF